MVGDSRVGAAALPPPSAPPSCSGQPRAMPWQASSKITVKSTMASRVVSSCGGVNAAVISLITWRQFGREGGSRALQGRLTGWCNSRVRCRMPGSNVQAWQGRTETGLSFLEGRTWFDPLCRACTASTRVQKVGARRVGWRRSQGSQRARTGAASRENLFVHPLR